jgi:hypothetical protein
LFTSDDPLVSDRNLDRLQHRVWKLVGVLARVDVGKPAVNGRIQTVTPIESFVFMHRDISDGCAADVAPCSAVSYSGRDSAVHVSMEMPFESRHAALASLGDFGGKIVGVRFAAHGRHITFSGVRFLDLENRMQLYVSGWRQGDATKREPTYYSILPADVSPESATKPHWH